MSMIFLQKDNITILGDIYEYPINQMDWEKIKKTIIRKALMIQIILVVNWKQKVHRTNYDLDDNLELISWNEWNELSEFIKSIWYDISEFSMRNWLEKAKEYDLPYNI